MGYAEEKSSLELGMLFVLMLYAERLLMKLGTMTKT